MRILWISNIIFPAVCDRLGLPHPVSGGWLYARAQQLIREPDIDLGIAAVYRGDEFKVITIEEITYYLLPVNRMDTYNRNLESLWACVAENFKPDIVHINGTEYPHGLACMNSLPGLQYIVSIQGLVSVIERYYLGCMTFSEVVKNTSLPEYLSGRTIFSAKRSIKRRGVYEREYIRRAAAISGRTTWDYAHTRIINPDAPYYHCSRTLRQAFYVSPKWKRNSAREYSIFVSKGTSPFKGIHQVLRAIALLTTEFPTLTLRIAGKDMLNRKGWRSALRFTAYQRFLARLVSDLGLQKHIVFCGKLNDQEMAAEMLQSHVFVCPSAIENSSNSIAEAQYLGVPTIATDVGGNMDMVEHGVSGFIYRFEEVELLAHYLRKVFTDDTLAESLSHRSIESATSRHNPEASLAEDLRMYRDIVVHARGRR